MALFWKKYSPQYNNFNVPYPEEVKNIPDYDLLSPCEFYAILDRECRSLANEVTTIWMTGERAKCDEWKSAYGNCEKWRTQKDRTALESVLTLERNLYRIRQVDMHLNNVWEQRESVLKGEEPAHFNAPLPLFLRKDDGQNEGPAPVEGEKKKSVSETADFLEKNSGKNSGQKKVNGSCLVM